MQDLDDYPRPPMRRRLLMVLLAVAMMVFLVWSVTRKSGVVRDAALHPADRPVCTAGQTTDCVGSATTVIVLPSQAPASPASPASR
jgi:hypothetical protein